MQYDQLTATRLPRELCSCVITAGTKFSEYFIARRYPAAVAAVRRMAVEQHPRQGGGGRESQRHGGSGWDKKSQPCHGRSGFMSTSWLASAMGYFVTRSGRPVGVPKLLLEVLLLCPSVLV